MATFPSRSPTLAHFVALFLESRQSHPNEDGGEYHLLVAPPGGGNIGDQAMVDAFVQKTHGPILIILRSPADVDISGFDAGRVRTAVLPTLIYSRLPQFARDYRQYLELLASARSISVVGADIMDGRYQYRPSVNRSRLLMRAARRGIPARVIGFSWSTKPHGSALRAIRAAGRAGVQLMVRDPDSLSRLQASGVVNLVETADIVFAVADREEPPSRVLAQLGVPLQGRFALVNVSGLIERQMAQEEHMVAVVDAFVARGLEVVLLPHVSRPDDDDIHACEVVYRSLVSKDHVTLVAELLSPAQIRWLASRATIVVTGRMHLAIMALRQGRVPITISTVGKVSGLLKLFGVQHLAVEPDNALGLNIVTRAMGVLDHPNHEGDLITQHLPRVTLLAERNAPRGDDAIDVVV